MSKEKIIFIYGNFNVLHPGHLRLLRFASECGDQLIVGVNSDRIAGKASYVREDLRIEGVASNSLVTKVILIDDLVSDVIDKMRPDIVVKGKEHQNRFNPEEKILKSYGGKLLFSFGETTFSSADLISKDLNNLNHLDYNCSAEYAKRHNLKKRC